VQAQAVALYSGPIRSALVRMKFHRDPSPAEALGAMLAGSAAAARACAHVDAIVPMPLSWRRRWWRGFNQSERLVAPLARELRVPLLSGALKRLHRVPQAGLSARARLRNVSGVFRASGVCGRAVLLFDDVMTTGATLLAAQEALKSGGARRVEILVLAAALLEQTAPDARGGAASLWASEVE
jgi:ComF family protein